MATADLVLEGGGVKGLGLVGAVLRLMREGYSFERLAGSSAGSIVAALLAAGATADDLAGAMDRLDYPRVPDRAPPKLPVVSEGISLLRRSGCYEGDYVRDFVATELDRLGVTTFADLRSTDPGADPNIPDNRRYRLVVTATDVTHGRLLRLPWDYPSLGLEPDRQLVADAVRASIAIPLFFEPVTIRHGTTGEETVLVDGGILSNFPIAIFDRSDRAEPRWPTLGVKVLPALPAGTEQLFPGLKRPRLQVLRLLEQVLATAIVGADQTYLERPCVKRRAIHVDTHAVGIVEFDAPEAKRKAVVASGDDAARRFLSTWDWERFKRECTGSSST
jgi:predicted acylesterase/phospholipase RssA